MNVEVHVYVIGILPQISRQIYDLPLRFTPEANPLVKLAVI